MGRKKKSVPPPLQWLLGCIKFNDDRKKTFRCGRISRVIESEKLECLGAATLDEQIIASQHFSTQRANFLMSCITAFNIKKNKHPCYNADVMLDTVKTWLGLKNDAALAQHLQITPSMICQIRNNEQPVSPELLLTMHEATALTIRDLRFLSGDFRWHTGGSTWMVSPSVAAWQLSEPARASANFARKRRYQRQTAC